MSAAAPPPDSSTVAQMKAAKRWLIYQAVPRPGTGKVDKRPRYASGTLRGKTDTPDDRGNLATLEEARKAVTARGEGWGLGFALGEDEHGQFWQGIDLDDVNESGLADLAESLPGYVEKSPSGKGEHAIGYGRAFKSLGSNGSGVEAYASGRFFTVTGKRVRDSALTCLAGFVEEQLAPRHGPMLLPAAAAPLAAPAVAVVPQVVATLRSALYGLRSDD